MGYPLFLSLLMTLKEKINWLCIASIPHTGPRRWPSHVLIDPPIKLYSFNYDDCVSAADLRWIQSISRLIELQLLCLFNGRPHISSLIFSHTTHNTFQVNDLISNNQLNICSEEKVFTAVLIYFCYYFFSASNVPSSFSVSHSASREHAFV